MQGKEVVSSYLVFYLEESKSSSNPYVIPYSIEEKSIFANIPPNAPLSIAEGMGRDSFEIFTNDFLRLEDFPPTVQVKKPIPIRIFILDSSEFIASFDEANIAMGGETSIDAKEALLEEILASYDALTEHEGRLGLQMELQLVALKKYIDWTS